MNRSRVMQEYTISCHRESILTPVHGLDCKPSYNLPEDLLLPDLPGVFLRLPKTLNKTLYL